jgi:hypothetical protein
MTVNTRAAAAVAAEFALSLAGVPKRNTSAQAKPTPRRKRTFETLLAEAPAAKKQQNFQ